MTNTVIKIENLSKVYRLGEVGTGTLSHDLNRFWKMNILGKDDPYAKVGQVNDRTQKAVKGELVSALKDINLEVKQGEVLGIIGKNGAGKSTLLKLLSRVTSPTTGSIKVKGRLASLLEVGTGFHPEMTGRENIYMNGTIMGMRKWEIDKKLDTIVDFAGITKYLDTPTKRYSSGMKVRLGFAVAAHLEPEILVVDEVLAVGDVEFQKKAIGKMQDVSQNQGRTVLFVSHNMSAIQSLCSKGFVLNNGQKLLESNVDESIEHYLSLSRNESVHCKLIHRSDRSGEGNLKFSDWSSYIIENNSNEPQPAITGKPFTITLEILANYDLNNIVFSLGFFDKNETYLTACRSDSVNKLFNIKKGCNKIKLFFDKFPLTKGEYSFNIVSYKGTVIQDWIKNAGIISVENGDYYGSGILPARGKQGVLTNYKWK